MADAMKVIRDKIATLRGFHDFTEEAAQDIGQIIWDDIAQSVSEGRSPVTGRMWVRRKDRKLPLQTAMDGLRLTTYRGTISITIDKRHLVLHHYGYARGNVRRPLLPDTLTPRMERKIREYFQRKMKERMEAAA